MKRNIVISTIIGALLTYLPFWMWDRPTEQLAAGATFALIAFVVLLVTEKSPRSGNSLRGLAIKNISQSYCKADLEEKQ